MIKLLFLLIAVSFLSACSHTYYIVRHAEKETPSANMSNDVPLSDKGKARAEALKELMKDKSIKAIYSTKTQRTQNTAKPTAEYFNIDILPYGPSPDSAFIASMKALRKNVLIVGHSNTVDDIVNGIGRNKYVPSDLPDSAYSNLFILKVRNGRVRFLRLNF